MGKVTHQEAILLSQQLKKAEDNMVEAIASASKIKKELREKCPHTVVEKSVEHIEGDYYNVGRYYEITNCSLCGKMLKHIETGTSGYG